MATDAVWFLQSDAERTNPLTPAQLRDMLEEGLIAPDAYVQHLKLPTWIPLVAVKGMAQVVQRRRVEEASVRPKASSDSPWMVAVDGQQEGPMSRAELGQRARRGMIHPDTLVWREGMRGWQRLDEVPELSSVVPNLDSITDTGRIRVVNRDEAKARLSKATPTSVADCRPILESNPEHEPTLQVLENMVRMGRDAQNAVELLEAVLVPAGQWQRLMANWRNLLRAVREPAARANLRVRMARAAEGPLDAPKHAFAILTSALRESPDRVDVHDGLERIAERLDRWNELAALLGEQISAHEGRFKAALLAFAAQLDLRHFDAPDRAAERLTQAARLDPGASVIAALEQLGERTADWQPWADGLRAAADAAEGDAKVPHLHQLANALQVRLNKAVRAVGVYAEILSIAPDDPQTRDALARLHRRGIAPDSVFPLLADLYLDESRWASLRELQIAHLRHLSPGAERAQGLFDLSRLCADRLKRGEEALDFAQQAVRQAPDSERYRAALLALAEKQGALPAAAATLEQTLTENPSLQAELAWALYNVHRELGSALEVLQGWARRATEAAGTERLIAWLPELEAVPGVQANTLERLVVARPTEPPVADLRLQLARLRVRAGESEAALRSYQALLADAPEHGEALAELAALHADAGRWPAWIELQRKRAELSVDEDARVAIWRETAGRAVEAHGDHTVASELWRRVLAAVPGDDEALDGLEAACVAQERWDEVADILERRRATAAGDTLQAVTRRLARVYSERLEDRPRATACWRALVRMRPEDDDARRALARAAEGAEALTAWSYLFEQDHADAEAAAHLATLHTEAGAWADLVDVRLRHTATFSNAEAAEVALRALLALCSAQSLDESPVLQALLARRPDDDEATARLAQHYASREDWASVEGTLRQRFERAPDAEARRAARVELAELQADRLGQPEAAFGTLLDAFTDAPDDALADDLARLAARTDQWPRLLAAYTGAAEAAEPALATNLHRRLMVWYGGPRDDAAQAVIHAGRVLDATPDDPQTIGALEAMFAGGRARAEIAALLEPAFKAAERWEALAELLGETLPDRGGPRVEALRRIGQIYEQRLDAPREALDQYAAALELAPAESTLHADVVRMGEALGRMELAVDAMTRALLRADAPDAVIGLGLKLAPLLEASGQRARALHVHGQILDADPMHPVALAAVDRAATEQQDVGQLVSVLPRRIQLAPVEERHALRLRLADAHDRIGDLAEAIAVWEAALAEAPNDVRALEAVDPLYVEVEDWAALATARQRLVELSGDDTRAARLEALIEVVDSHLDDAEAAIPALTRLIEVDGDSPERLDRLEALLRAKGRWDALEALAERQLPTSPERELRLYRAMAEAQTHLDRGRDALESWRQLLDRDPEDTGALRASRALYLDRELPAGLGHTDLRLAALLDDDDPEKGVLLREAAQAFDRAGHTGEAAQAWTRLRAVLPDDPEANAALEALYTQTGAWARLGQLWESILARTHGSDARLALHLQVAQLRADRLNDIDGARAAYETALSESPGSPRATVALGELYARQEDWSAWVELAMARLGEVQDVGARRTIYTDAAQVLTERLDDPGQAFALLAQAVREHPDDGLGEALEALAERLERWNEVVELYESALDDAQPEAQAAMHQRLAAWVEERLGDPDRATTHHRAVLALDPDDEPALAALQRLFEGGHARASIVDELARRHEAAGDWQRLHELLASAVPESPVAARAAAWRRLGELAADKLGAPQHALDWYARALAELPDDDEARTRLLELGESTGRLDQVAGVLDRILPRAQAAVRPIAYALADVYERIGDPDGAEEIYDYLLEEVGAAESAALAALEVRFAATGRWAELAERLEAALQSGPPPDQQADIAARLARMYEEQLGHTEQAVTAWRAVLAAEPQDDEALAALSRLHQSQEEWGPLFQVLAREAEADPRVRAERYARMADIAAEHLGRPKTAIELWQKSMAAGGDQNLALAALQTLYTRQGQWAELVGVLRRRQTTASPSEAAELIRLKARVLTDHLDDLDAARAAWGGVRRYAPTDEEALRALWRLSGSADPAEVVDLTRALLTVVDEQAPDWAAIQRARARACDGVGDELGARVAWEALRAVEPDDTEAEERLAALYGRQSDFGALVSLREAQAEAAETQAERIECLIALASVHDDRGATAAARSALDRAMAVRPEDDALAERLMVLHAERDRWNAVGDLLLRGLAELTDPAERRRAYLEAAERLETGFERPQEALGLLCQGFADSPSDADFGPVIERLAQATGDWSTAEALYTQHLDVLDGRGPGPRLRLGRWLADHLGDAAAARPHFEAVFGQDPGNDEAAEALIEILRGSGDYAALQVALLRRADHLPGEQAVSLRAESAEIAATHLDEPARIRAWQGLLAADPTHRAALDGLEGVYRAREQWAELVDVLGRKADSAEPAEATELRLAIADLTAEHLGDEEAAMTAYRRALALEPHNKVALAGVERVLTRRSAWDELVRFHEDRLAIAPPAERHAIYARIAEIQAEKQHNVAAAKGTERVMRQSASRGRSTQALERVYIESERWEDLAALYERRLKVIPEGGQERSLRTTLATIYADQLEELDKAIEVLEPLLESDDAGHQEIKETLETLLVLQERREDWDGSVEVLKKLSRTCDEGGRVEVYMRIGRMYADRLGNAVLATQWWRAALELDNHHRPAVQAIDALHAKIRSEYDGARREAEAERARLEAEEAAKVAQAAAAAEVVTLSVAGDDDVLDLDQVNIDTVPLPTVSGAAQPLAPTRLLPPPPESERQWVAPAVGGVVFTLVAVVVLWSVWPDGRSLEPALISVQQEVAHAISPPSGPSGNAIVPVSPATTPPATPRSVAPSRRTEPDLTEEALVVRRMTERVDQNLVAIETALSSTGLDYEALLNPVVGEEPVVPGGVGGPMVEPPSPHGFVSPIAGPMRLLSPYGPRGREHHDGIDMLAAVGTPVRAVAAGEVIFIQSRESWENRAKFVERDGVKKKSPAWRAGVYLELKHDDDKVSRYMHLHRVAPGIEKGSRVQAKQVVGYVGRSAVEHSATHLHFELRDPDREGGRFGDSVDPLPILNPEKTGFIAGTAAIHARKDLGRAPGGDQVRRKVREKLRGLSLLEKMDRLQNLESLLQQLPLVAPVEDYRLSSAFGRRIDPGTGKPGFHPGVDMPGELKTPIKAAAPGTVVYAGWKGIYGRVVELDHGNGIVTRYGHLYSALVRPGQKVRFREKLGEMGTSGRSTGTHLHYEVLVDGEHQDPLKFLQAGRYIFKR